MIDTAEAYGLTFRFPAGDEVVGASLRDFGEFARPELDFLLACADSDTGTLLDVGANIGAIGLPFAASRPHWSVIAIEAHTGLAGLISASVAGNRLANVDVMNVAAGPEPGWAEYPNAALSGRGNFGELGLHMNTPHRRRVRMVTLDEIAPSDTRLVKIDVQGFEPSVLAGAPKLRHEIQPIWVVEAIPTNPEASRLVIRTLAQDGYQLWWFFSPFATPKAPKGTPPAPKTGDSSIVAVPTHKQVPWRLSPVVGEDDVRPPRAAAYPYLIEYGY